MQQDFPKVDENSIVLADPSYPNKVRLALQTFNELVTEFEGSGTAGQITIFTLETEH